jgi:hypothetical protein
MSKFCPIFLLYPQPQLTNYIPKLLLHIKQTRPKRISNHRSLVVLLEVTAGLFFQVNQFPDLQFYRIPPPPEP